MVYVVGDVHLRSEEPFFSVTQRFLTSLADKCEKGDSVIFTGDFFHRSRPYSEELFWARHFFEVMKEKGCFLFIIAGNHEYFREHDSWAEDAFKEFDVELIEQLEVRTIEDMKFLFLPWMPQLRLRKIYGYQSMRDFYDYYIPKFLGPLKDELTGKTLYVVYHFEDETVFTGTEDMGVDLSIIEKIHDGEVVRLGGHIHNPTDNYIGAPYATRRDESGFKRHIVSIGSDGMKYIDMPNAIEYRTLMYGELKDQVYDPDTMYLLKILDAPSFEEINGYVHRFNNVWIDDYELRFGEQREVMVDKEDVNVSVKEFLGMYIKQNKVDPDTANYLLSVF